jgi:hypothetical protein
MKALVVSLAAGLALITSAPAASQKLIDVPEHPVRPVVVELFSSQSCGNCPEANRNVAELAKRSDVIALTYPVGYWDYLGWDDTFAKPEFAERQKRYNRALGHRGPYTPQIVYSGRLHSSGVNIEQIADGFAKRDVSPYPAKVKFSGDTVEIDGTVSGSANLVLIEFRPGATKVTPGGGANKGKPMAYHNLVTSYRLLGEWKGGAATFPAKCGAGCVVLVQAEGAEGRVIGAARKTNS